MKRDVSIVARDPYTRVVTLRTEGTLKKRNVVSMIMKSRVTSFVVVMWTSINVGKIATRIALTTPIWNGDHKGRIF